MGLRLSIEGYANTDIWAIMERFVIALFVCPARRRDLNSLNMDHARIERLLRLMLMLSSNVDYTTPELADLLEITERSIYRYIRSFKDNGFVLEKRNPNIHKLLKMPLDEIKLDELIQISSEEAFILHTLLLSITGGSQIHINLEQKLAALFDATSITEIIGKKTAAENVRILKKAIDEKECVELIDYESGHTMKVSDRIVEPYGFSTNYADVYAYEPASGICKTFKITRIGWVRPIGAEWEFEEKHEVIDPDCFRMNGKESIPVTLRMTLMAKNLLIEEYPLSMRDISYKDGYWLLNTVVKDLAGVGRFFLGLSDQIEIIDSPKLESYVKRRVRKDLAKFIEKIRNKE